MPYLEAVVKESLRLHSSVGLPMWRVVPEGGIEIAGQFLPAGTNVGINAWVAHRNKDVWGQDADVFRPERWLEAQAEADAGSKARLQRMEAYYMPFGLGSRTCIGRHVSMFEISKLVPRLVRDFAFGGLERRERVVGPRLDFLFRVRAQISVVPVRHWEKETCCVASIKRSKR